MPVGSGSPRVYHVLDLTILVRGAGFEPVANSDQSSDFNFDRSHSRLSRSTSACSCAVRSNWIFCSRIRAFNSSPRSFRRSTSRLNSSRRTSARRSLEIRGTFGFGRIRRTVIYPTGRPASKARPMHSRFTLLAVCLRISGQQAAGKNTAHRSTHCRCDEGGGDEGSMLRPERKPQPRRRTARTR
jgi:hypothetical protein